MVTSISTPGSMLMEVIFLTISEGECKSMMRLWILIWKRKIQLVSISEPFFELSIEKIFVTFGEPNH